MVKRLQIFVVGELIACRLYLSQLTVGSTDFTTGRIAPIGRSNQTEYKIRQDETSEIGLSMTGKSY